VWSFVPRSPIVAWYARVLSETIHTITSFLWPKCALCSPLMIIQKRKIAIEHSENHDHPLADVQKINVNSTFNA